MTALFSGFLFGIPCGFSSSDLAKNANSAELEIGAETPGTVKASGIEPAASGSSVTIPVGWMALAAVGILWCLYKLHLLSRTLKFQEKRFHLITNNLKEIIFSYDMNAGEFTFISPAYQTIFDDSTPGPGLDIKLFLDKIHEGDRELVTASAARSKYGIGFDGDFRILRPDNSVRWIHVTTIPVGPATPIQSIVGIAEDITDRRRMEDERQQYHDKLEQTVSDRTGELMVVNKKLWAEIEKHKETQALLQEREETFSGLVNNALVGICVVSNGDIIYKNPELEKHLGIAGPSSSIEILDKVHPDDREKAQEIENDIGTGRSRTLYTTFRIYPGGHIDDPGSMRWIHCRVSYYTYQGNQTMLINTMDVTRVRELEHSLMIKDRMVSLGRIAAGIAHEIRNPLTGINSYLYTLEDLCDEEELNSEGISLMKQITSQIQLASNKIENVIRRVLDFSKPAPIQLAPININYCIKNAISLSAAALRKERVTTHLNLANNIPLCMGDSSLIEQVILNLIVNAAKAMESSSEEGRISISSGCDDSNILVRVSDSGPGVPVEIRDRIFDPFYTTKADGSGIGLSIVQRIVNDHKGSVSVAASQWDGAEFRIRLPIHEG